MNLRYKATALEDIDAIFAWRARVGAEVAEKVASAIFTTGEWLAAHPNFGAKTDEAEVRRWPMTDLRYVIFYSIDRDKDALVILRIMDGRRVQDLKRLPR
jgi:plasmid stabilization system protein ParE